MILLNKYKLLKAHHFEGTSSSLMEMDDNSSIKIEKVETNLEDELPEEDNDADSKMDAYKSMTNSALKLW